MVTVPWYTELYQPSPIGKQGVCARNPMVEVDFIEAEVGYDKNKTILDVGCGSGRHAVELSRRGYPVVSVDLSESMLVQKSVVPFLERRVTRLLRQDVRNLDLDMQVPVALCLCEGGFSLMEKDEMDLFLLHKIEQSLEPDGKLILTAPNAVYLLSHHPRCFDPIRRRATFHLKTVDDTNHAVDLTCGQRWYTTMELSWLLNRVGLRVQNFFSVSERGFDFNHVPGPDHLEIGVIAVKP